MDEFQKNNPGKDIDLTAFDLSEFEEYFKEEDAQKEAEEKARLQKEAELEEERLAQQEAELLELEKQAELEEQQAREDLEAKRKELFEQREKEEAKKAAERAAAAALAAKKAEEAKEREQREISQRLLSQANVNNSLNPEDVVPKTVPVVDKAEKVEFSKFNSILDIKTNSDEASEEAVQEISQAPSDNEKSGKKTKVIALICAVILIVAAVGAYLVFGTDIFNKNDTSPEESTTASTQASEENDIIIPFNDLF